MAARLALALLAPPPAAAADRPRPVVLIAIDQVRHGYIVRRLYNWADLPQIGRRRYPEIPSRS